MKLVKGVLVLSAAAITVWFVRGAVEAVFYNYGLDYGEAVVLNVVRNIPEHPWIYKDLNREPFTLAIYQPLYFYLVHLVALITGPTFAAGRIVSLTAALAASGVLFGLLRLGRLDRVSAWALSVVPWFWPSLKNWFILMKPDSPGLFLNLCGVYLIYRDETWGRQRLFPAAAWVCFFAAFAFKQSYVTGFAAFALYLAARRRWAGLFRWTVVTACALGVWTLFWDRVTQGAYTLELEALSHHEISLKILKGFWLEFAGFAWPWLLAAAAVVFTFVVRKKNSFALFYALTALMSTALAGVIGANSNYFFEWAYALLWLSGIGIASLKEASAARVAAATGLCGFMILGLWTTAVQDIRAGESLSAKERDQDELVEIIRKVPGDVFSENMSLLLAAGKPILYEPFEFTQLIYDGLWDEEKIVSRIRERKFALMVLNTNPWAIRSSSRFSPGFIRALREYYRPLFVRHGHLFLTPRQDV